MLTFASFMKEFKSLYLPKDWEEITCIELLQMTQGNNMFCNFAIQVQVVLPQLSSAQLFFSFFVTENAVIDVTVREMVTNIASLHTLSKYMQPILKYSKNNMWF